MRAFLYSVLLVISIFGSLIAQDLDQLQRQQEQRLSSARQKLSSLRQKNTTAILPLQKELRELRSEEREWRKRFEDHQAVRDSLSLSLDDLKKERDSSREEFQYLENILLREFFAEHRSSLPVHSPRNEELRLLDLKIESGTLSKRDIVPNQLSALLNIARDLRSSYGGEWSNGKALGPDGDWHEGQVLDLGPEAFFKADEPSSTGRLTEGLDHRSHIDERVPSNLVAKWMEKSSGSLPIDVSGGQALKAMEYQTTFFEHVKKGGMWVIPIIFFATISALIAIFKMLVLYTVKMPPVQVGYQMALLLKKGDQKGALALASAQPSSCRKMFSRAVESGQGDPDFTEEIMTEAILEKQPSWERFHGLIAVTAAVAPLLGLLGTVTGIIKTFQMMEVFGAGDPRPLIGGISEALITTELGLILAIPALLLHAMLSRRAQSLLSRMERCAMATVNGLLGDHSSSSDD
jgi:biopolymer transport protein ExbB